MALPNWPGASIAYKRCSTIIGVLCRGAATAHYKRTGKLRGYSVPAEVDNIIEALDIGDEEEIKGFMNAYSHVWSE